MQLVMKSQKGKGAQNAALFIRVDNLFLSENINDFVGRFLCASRAALSEGVLTLPQFPGCFHQCLW
jgi:hypothetical protein